jgi:acetyltransferase-like isoleucine patch superfamily enzyme
MADAGEDRSSEPVSADPHVPVRLSLVGEDRKGWDPGVVVGYRPDRQVQDLTLVIGAGARLRSGTVIYGGSRIGHRLQTGHNVVIREENALGDDVAIWSNSLIDYGCQIGNRVKIHANVYIPQFSIIEDEVFIAPGATFANDMHPGCECSAATMRGPILRTGARIGVNVTILPGVEIGAYALIGSGSVVTRDVPPGKVAHGNPARIHGAARDLRCSSGGHAYPNDPAFEV